MLTVAFVVLLVAAASFLTGALSLDGQPAVHAQNSQGAISNLSVLSPGPGQLVATWSAPGETPTDYRMRWAPSGQDYLSYSESNTSERGSAYSEVPTLTVDNLTAGADYKVQVRARYHDGQHQDNPWSGPWSDETTVTVSGTPAPASDEVTGLALSSDAAGQLVITWNEPSDQPSDYRVAWAPAGEDYLSYAADNTSRRGNSYPAASTLTLTGLPGGVDYKVMVRARYRDEQNGQARSGPWTDEATGRVRDDAAAADAQTTRDEPTPEPTAEPTPVPTPQPGEIAGLTLSSDTRGALEMEWTAADPAPDRYWINWGESHLAFPSLEDRNFNFAWTGTDMYFGDSIVDAGKTYQVRVRAVYDADGDEAAWNGPWSDTETQRVRSNPPQAPGSLSIGVVNHDGVSLSWSAPTHDVLTGYRVLRGVGAASLDTLAELGVDARSYTDTATDGATTYHYAVVALSQDGDSPRSSAVSATTPPRTPVTPVIAGAPDAPTGLTGTLDGNGGVTLSWTDPNDSAITGYRVLRGADARSLVVIAEDTGSAAVSYTDAAPAANATHVYAVQARNAVGLSQLSATFSATTLNPPFGVGADVGAFDVMLSWRTPDGDGITGCQVLRGATADEMTVIADDTASTDTAYVDAPVSPETTYYYAVRARSAQGLGSASPAHLVTTPAAASLVFLDDDNLETQQQQGSHTMVSNLSNPVSGSTVFVYKASGFEFQPEQSFRTGRHPAGYSVTEIQARIARVAVGANNARPLVHIHANSGSGSGAPGQRLHSFTEHTGFARNSIVRFTSTSTVTLNPNTRYWLVFGLFSPDLSDAYTLKQTERLTARTDPCGELDWSIDPLSTVGLYVLNPPSRPSSGGRNNGVLVAIVGSQVDDGSASELECTDTGAATTTYTNIGMGATVIGAQHGDAYSNDEDWYQVTLEAGVKYQFDTFTSIFGFGYSASDGYISGVYDSTGTAQTGSVIETQDVGPEGGAQRRRAYFTPAAAGAYYLAVKPGPHGGPSGSVESAQDVPTYGVRVRKADDYPATTSTTGVVTAGGSVGGHFFARHRVDPTVPFDMNPTFVTDTDWIRVALTADQRYRFTLTLHGATATSGATIVGVYNSSGTKVANGADAPKSSVTVQSWYTPSGNGDYYVALTYANRKLDTTPDPNVEAVLNPWVTTPDYTLSVVED